MKKNLLITLSIVITALFFMSNSGGRASATNSGNTGAPGDASGTCIGCHGGGGITTDLGIQVMDPNGAIVSSYVPGVVYDVMVTMNVTSGSASGYGFQMVSLMDAMDTDVAAFSNPGSNTQIATAGGRQYAEHNGTSSSNTFSVKWTAPATGSGSVTFYASGNAVNGNGNITGDGADDGSLSLLESDPSSVSGVINDFDMTVFPNPVRDVLNLSSTEVQFANLDFQIVDMTGKIVRTGNTILSGGNTELDVNEFSSGNYTILLTDGQAKSSIKFLKL